MKKAKVDWIIHHVIGEEGTVSHTHGLNAYGMLELELNLPFESNQAQEFINIIAMSLIERDLKITGEYCDEGLFNCKVFYKRAKSIYGGEDVLRIIFPDPNFLFPWEDGCIEPYKSQI